MYESTRMTRIVNLIYPELSYKITGLLCEVHRKLGRYCKERQYQDMLETILKKNDIAYIREIKLPIAEDVGGNQADFLIEDQSILECKAKPFITKEDYYQILQYLRASNKRLGLLVNFRNRYLKPKRIVN